MDSNVCPIKKSCRDYFRKGNLACTRCRNQSILFGYADDEEEEQGYWEEQTTDEDEDEEETENDEED